MGDEPLGFTLNDLGKVLEDAVTPTRRRRPAARSRASGGDMDAALRRAVRVELEETSRAIRELRDEVAGLRRSNEALLAKLARLSRG